MRYRLILSGANATSEDVTVSLTSLDVQRYIVNSYAPTSFIMPANSADAQQTIALSILGANPTVLSVVLEYQPGPTGTPTVTTSATLNAPSCNP